MSACWPTLDLPEGAYSNAYAITEVKVGWGDTFPTRSLAGLEYAAYSFGFFATMEVDFERERLVNDCVRAAVKHGWLTRPEAVVMFNRAWDSGREVALLKQQFNAPSYERHDVK